MKYYVNGQLIAVRTDRPEGEIALFSDELHMLALANGYVKADDIDALAKSEGCMKFDAEEVVYLMAAVEKMKCDDCEGHCAISNNNRCLYHALRTKLEALKEALDDR